jgi:cold-inducible RNA-binding protein
MSKRLYVGNLSPDTSVTDLERVFAPWGGSSANIPVDEWRRPKHCGFIDVADDQLEAAVTAMDGQELAGRRLTVCEARWSEDLGGYGKGRGGHYSGGRGGYGEGGAGGGGRW